MNRGAYSGLLWKSILLASPVLASICLATGCTQAELPLWRVHEITLTATVNHPRPEQVTLWVTFEDPDGETLQVPGFWDGGDIWRVRFAPTRQGRWTWITACSETEDRGLHGVTGKLRVGPPEGENPLYQHGGFLRVSENRRYLTYTDGTPFFWLGDTWWCCPSPLVPIDSSDDPAIPSMFKALVDRRSEQGYTVVHWAFKSWASEQELPPDARFTTLAQQQRVNPAYWQQVDAYMSYATEAGLVPAIALTWYSELDQLSLEELQFLWHYVIARYAAYPAVWLVTGEYNVIEKNANIADRIAKVAKLGQYIKDTDPYHRAMTVHPWWYQGDKGQIWDEPWYDFIMFQGGHQAFPGVEIYEAA